jgi:glycosyltransferase involved in cell wall biosynthesis
MPSKEKKLTVCVIAFNHEKYIRECIESLLNQITNFEFEIIVGDDNSTDNTRTILDQLKKDNPDKIRLILQKENIGGGNNNYLTTHAAATGEYVAHMDGDDFALPGKLQYQVDILDRNKNYSQCWTCANVVDENGFFINIFPSRAARVFNPLIITTKDIVLSYALVGHHSTQMYRRNARDVTKMHGEVLDFYAAFINSLSGDSFYSKEIFSAYRVGSQLSITRNPSKKRVAVDLLSRHLLQISIDYPQYSSHAYANLYVRRLFSIVAGHDLFEINNALKNIRARKKIILIAKSALMFLLQKIK